MASGGKSKLVSGGLSRARPHPPLPHTGSADHSSAADGSVARPPAGLSTRQQPSGTDCSDSGQPAMGSGGCLGSQFFLPVRTIFTEQSADKRPFFSVSAPYLPATSQANSLGLPGPTQVDGRQWALRLGSRTLVFRPLHEIQFTRAVHMLGK